MEEALHFAKLFLDYVDQARRKLGMSHSDLARAAFPGHQDPVGCWRKIRNHNQHLKVVDGYRLAHAIYQDFASICWKISQSMEGYSLPVPPAGSPQG